MDEIKLRAELLKYRTYLVDTVTGLPTLSMEMENLRRIIQEIDNQEFEGVIALIIMEVSQLVEETAGWTVFDSVMKDISLLLKRMREEDPFMKNIASIMLPVIRSNEFLLLLVKEEELPNKDKYIKEGMENLKNKMLDIIRNYVSNVFPDMINSGYAYVVNDIRKRFERVMYDAYNKAYMNLIENQAKRIDAKTEVLKDIILNNKIITYYQPIVNVNTMEIIGYEALSRVTNNLFPNSESLFAYAIETDYLFELERICRKNAIDHIVNEFPENALLFLNNSARGIIDESLVNGEFEKTLESVGITIDRVVLELTERIAIENYEYYLDVLKQLKNLGYKIAIDDMGAGYSSMRTLAELKPDFLKYDMNLVRDIHKSNIKQELLKALVDVASSIGSEVIAEGVEVKEELDTVTDIGVHYAQGYYLNIPKREIVRTIK